MTLKNLRKKKNFYYQFYLDIVKIKLKKTLICIIVLSFFNTSSNSIASTEVIVDEAVNQLIKNLGNIETATKGKKLKKFFTGNSLKLLFNDKIREFKFKENKYEIFENEKSIENGKWKLSGILKNHIKLTPNNKSKPYFFKKINNKEIIYHYNGTPGKEGTIKTIVKINPLIEEKTKVAQKKEEPKKVETKVAEKKEEPKKVETKVAEKKEEPKKAETKVADKKSGIKTKEDLETFLIGTEIKSEGVYDDVKYIWSTKFDLDGIAYQYSQGMKTKIIWEVIDGNTYKTAMPDFMDYGWTTNKIDYEKLTYTSTSEKTWDENKVMANGDIGGMVDKVTVTNVKILAPTIFEKKEFKKKEVTVIPDGQILQILQVNCNGGFVSDDWNNTEQQVQYSATFEIDFDGGYIYTTFRESMNPKGNKAYKSRDKIISYDKKKITAIGSPYLTFKDIGQYEIEYTFNYKMMDKITSKDTSTFGNFVEGTVNGKKYIMIYHCYGDTYLADKLNIEKTLKTYSNSDGYPEPYDFAKGNEAFDKDFDILQKKNAAELEKEMAKINEQISGEYKNSMKSFKMKSNKYGSSQLEQTKKIVENVTKEDFKTYNVTSLISYYFFDSMSNYMESLEFLYRAYDKNADADKLKAQIAYLKSSKASEKERLETTKQIINTASLEIEANVQDESIVLSEEAKINYQKALPLAFKATDSGYKLFVVSKGLVTEIKGSTNLLGALLKNANELQGAATVVPLIPDYIKKVGSTAKLIFSGAKTKKIKDKENLSAALDELDLSA